MLHMLHILVVLDLFCFHGVIVYFDGTLLELAVFEERRRKAQSTLRETFFLENIKYIWEKLT